MYTELEMAEKSYTHKPAIKPMDYRTLAQCYDEKTALHPQKEAFVIYDNNGQRSVYTFQEVKDKSVEIAGLLLQIGITRGQRVALMAPNCIEFAWCFLALNRIGANAILIPYGRSEEEVSRAIIQRLKCQALLVYPSGDTAYDHHLVTLAGKIIDKRKIVNIGPEKGDLFVTNLTSLLGATKVNESEVYRQQDKVQFDDHVVVVFTSGSTGQPKAIQFTNHAIAHEALAFGMYVYNFQVTMNGAQTKGIDSRFFSDRDFAGFFIVLFNVVLSMPGYTLITIPATTSVQEGQTEFMLRVLQDEKCTHAFLMPHFICNLISSQSAMKYDLGNLKVVVSGGEVILKEYLSQLQRILPNCSLNNLYAMAEIEPIAMKIFNDKSPDTYDSMNVIPSMELKIINDKNEVVTVGQKGEICVRSPFSSCGYLEDPKAKMHDFDTHGWIHTGDVGYIDHQGGVHVCGRMKHVITKGTDKICPVEVESVLSLYPDIKAVAVVGVPDDHLNEQICACVILKAGSELESSVTEFDQWASSQWKADDVGLIRKQRYTLVLKEFPINTSGKIDRKALKAIAMEKLGIN